MVGSINRTVAESEVSPSFPTMTVSVKFTPMVIMLCKEIGMAITAIFL